MIIEFTGLPGSGKSKIISELKRKADINVIYDLNFYLFKIKKTSYLKTLLIDFLIFINIMNLKKKDISLIMKIINDNILNRNSFFHKINIIRNIVKCLICFRLIENKNETFILDEGPNHILFYLFSNNDFIAQKSDYEYYYKLLPKVDKLIIVDETNNVIINRLKSRGPKAHRRMRFDNLSIKNFVISSRNVVEYIKAKNMNSLIFINKNSNKINLTEIIKIIHV